MTQNENIVEVHGYCLPSFINYSSECLSDRIRRFALEWAGRGREAWGTAGKLHRFLNLPAATGALVGSRGETIPR